METLDQIRDRLLAAFPSAQISIVLNPGPAAQHSLLLDREHGREIAQFLRDDSALKLDYCSNATGVDYLDKEIVETIKKTVPPEAVPVAGVGDPGPASPRPATPTAAKVVEEKIKRTQPGYLEAVYHLFSMTLKHGPLVIRMRTANRTDAVTLPSLTPVWRSCEFQEREIFDLFGIVFEGHPDLRRILMWDAFKDHPMRKDYVEPDDYEWEPTPHDEVLAKAKQHYPAPAAPSAAAASTQGGATS